MTAKKLKLVASNDPLPGSPPRNIGKHGMELWRSIQDDYAVNDAGGIEILLQGCQALDRAESCREKIDREGETMRLKSGLYKDHPLLRHELSNRAFVTRCIQRLGLDVEAVKPRGRPPGY